MKLREIEAEFINEQVEGPPLIEAFRKPVKLKEEPVGMRSSFDDLS
jgi:hypothetical protein